MIKIVCFDIDGVLTNGMIYVREDGKEIKSYRLNEIDAINEIKKLGYKIVAITGEDTPIVSIFRKRIKWDAFFSGCKDKLHILDMFIEESRIGKNETCYIGDGKYDIPCIQYAGLGVCPSNAIQEAKDVADIVLKGAGGESCIYELFQILKKMKESEAN